MSPKSPLAPCHVNNGTEPMKENGGGVTGISSPFFWSLEEDPTPSSGLWHIKLTTLCPLVMEAWESNPALELQTWTVLLKSKELSQSEGKAL